MAKLEEASVNSENSVLAQRLKETFGSEKLSVTSKKLDVSVASIGYWKTGRSKPDLDKIMKICETYQVSADWLLGYTDENNFNAVSMESAIGATALSRESVQRIKNSLFRRELKYFLDEPQSEKLLEAMAKISGHAFGLQMALADIEELSNGKSKRDPFAREKTSELRGKLRTAIDGVRLNRFELSERALKLADTIYSLDALLEESSQVLEKLDEELRFLSQI